jgi:threonine dehydratase
MSEIDPLLLPNTVRATREKLRPWINSTPVHRWFTLEKTDRLHPDTQVWMKLELFQFTNTFKPRGALNVMLNADQLRIKNGIVAATGGNHGIAVAYAANQLGYKARIFIPHTASPLRRQRCVDYGAEVIPCETLGEALDLAAALQAKEDLVFVHPFEGPYTAQGTATIADEWKEQAMSELDAVIISIGGGGLIAGMAAYFKQVWPNIKIYGVEPTGAPTIHAALQTGKPVRLEGICTIADSLSAPEAKPYSFNLIQKYVDDVVLISDDDMRHAMAFLFTEMKLVAEPACAAPVAALLGPLKDPLAGKRVGLLACGSNLDIAIFAKEIFQGQIV